MFIPLDRLYQFIDQKASEIYGGNVVIYRFWPHGSKNINDLSPLLLHKNWYEFMINPYVWCHDQEPLDYDFYKDQKRTGLHAKFKRIKDNLPNADFTLHNIHQHWNIFSKSLLLHSEKRSQNLQKYLGPPAHSLQSQLIGVYYWSHGLIARDWFRYAQHEKFNKNIRKKFLIYNRAWAGSREYRLKFTDLLIDHGLIDHCLTFCNPIDNSIHYNDYQFKNNVWKPHNRLEKYVGASDASSLSSADFATADYNNTEIEVVLETLFDDDRLHLTEKSLRPIACRQPFILMATHGSLQYLRDYGFQTFETVWDESYDLIEDPYQRMLAVVYLMNTIASWTPQQRSEKLAMAQKIVAHNQQHFFSDEFASRISNELCTNLRAAFEQVKKDPGFDVWTDHWKSILVHKEIQEFIQINQDEYYPTVKQYNDILTFIAEFSQPTGSPAL